MRGFMILFVMLGLVACRGSGNDPSQAKAEAPAVPSGSGSASKPPGGAQQVASPFDLSTPPDDATKTASGLIYKKLVSNDAGAQPKRNDTVLINYAAWRQRTGEMFFSNKGRGQPLPLNLSQTAPGFTEGLQLMRKGEKAVLWVPPAIGYKTPPKQGTPETLVYEVEIVDITPAPAIPDDVARPPANAEALKSGIKLVRVRPGVGTDKVRPFDTATFNYTFWDGEGRMVETTETATGRPVSVPPYKQSVGMREMLTVMSVGERVRFWVDAAKMLNEGKAPGGVTQGLLCYEVDMLQVARAEHEPPPAPPDVAKPPPDALKTRKGVFYRVLKPSTLKERRSPSAKESVKVRYTGWTTDGWMFDSSFLRGEPAAFSLQHVIAGWTDGIPLMAVGDHVRFWIPESLAYMGAADKPAGMLVFDVELVEIMPLGTLHGKKDKKKK